MMKRHVDKKIPDIKMMRIITTFLGRLGLKTCRRLTHDMGAHQAWYYGWGLKESKDYVERKYEYVYEDV
jgi:ribosomal protein L7/L12